jgi:hypothetical protein
VSERADIRDVRNDVRGFFVTLRCRGCGESFERYLRTLAGLALGEYACPACRQVQRMEPEAFLDAVRRAFAEVDAETACALADAAAGIAERWHRAPELAELLSHRGVALGPPTERELHALFLRGLQRGGGGDPG